MCDISTTTPPIQATKKDPEMILFPENSVMKEACSHHSKTVSWTIKYVLMYWLLFLIYINPTVLQCHKQSTNSNIHRNTAAQDIHPIITATVSYYRNLTHFVDGHLQPPTHAEEQHPHHQISLDICTSATSLANCSPCWMIISSPCNKWHNHQLTIAVLNTSNEWKLQVFEN